MRIIFVLISLIIVWSFVSICKDGQIDVFGNLDIIEISISLFIEVLGIYFLFKNAVFTSRFKIVLLFCLYSCFIVLLTASNFILDLRCVLWWPVIYMIFYSASYRKYLTVESKYVKYYLILLFGIVVILYVYSKILNPSSYFIQGQEFFIRRGNLIFYVATLLPIAFFHKQYLRYIILILGLLATIFSFKRSVIIVSVFLLILSLCFDLKSQNKRFFKYLTVVVFFLLICYIVQNIDSGMTEYLLERFYNIKEGGGSGRSDIYNVLLTKYFDQDFIQMMFGSGYNSVVKYQNISANGVSLSAHNDYLEYLYDFGFIGFVFYLWFTYALMKCIYKCKKITIRYLVIAVFFTFLFLGLISHLALYPTYICYLMIMIGMLEGYIDSVIKRI